MQRLDYLLEDNPNVSFGLIGPNFHFDIDSFKVVKNTNSSFDVIIYEALLIKKCKPSLNVQLHKSGSFYTCKVY